MGQDNPILAKILSGLGTAANIPLDVAKTVVGGPEGANLSLLDPQDLTQLIARGGLMYGAGRLSPGSVPGLWGGFGAQDVARQAAQLEAISTPEFQTELARRIAAGEDPQTAAASLGMRGKLPAISLNAEGNITGLPPVTATKEEAYIKARANVGQLKGLLKKIGEQAAAGQDYTATLAEYRQATGGALSAEETAAESEAIAAAARKKAGAGGALFPTSVAGRTLTGAVRPPEMPPLPGGPLPPTTDQMLDAQSGPAGGPGVALIQDRTTDAVRSYYTTIDEKGQTHVVQMSPEQVVENAKAERDSREKRDAVALASLEKATTGEAAMAVMMRDMKPLVNAIEWKHETKNKGDAARYWMEAKILSNAPSAYQPAHAWREYMDFIDGAPSTYLAKMAGEVRPTDIDVQRFRKAMPSPGDSIEVRDGKLKRMPAIITAIVQDARAKYIRETGKDPGGSPLVAPAPTPGPQPQPTPAPLGNATLAERLRRGR